ncbi:hypothetical protein BG015_012083 [Linnemannia schmuckeri]|uniref:Uncharacterized protein n=1 Tax=Linnemannia schmuckeri TaxID=64567 RepID=A0A9P5S532_9FUNG|nr:hypothetical protein BG015_012083 [Linnemannia schmuckeri]
MQTHDNRIFQIAAILTRTRRYLTSLDLTRCVRASQTWHRAFIPHLWHTFTDGARSQWTSRVQQAVRRAAYDTGDNNNDDVKDVEWYLDVYRRHAKYIRRLTISHPLVLEALLEGGLRVPPSSLSSSSPVVPGAKRKKEEGREEGREVSLVTRLEHVEIFILWNVIRRYFRYRPIPGVRGTHSLDDQSVSAFSDAEDDTPATDSSNNNTDNGDNSNGDTDTDKDKGTTATTTATICTTDDVIGEALWRLLLANPGIEFLELRQDFPLFRQLLQQTNPTPTALESIQFVTTQLVRGRLPVLPPKTFQVEANYARFSRYNREDPPGPVNHAVEEVTVKYVEHLGQLRQILVQAPRLKALYIKELALVDTTTVHEEDYDDAEEVVKKLREAELEAEEEAKMAAAVASGEFTSGVQVVRCEHLHRRSSSGLERLFRLTPHLVEFYNTCWTPGYASILSENCPLLEIVRIASPRQQAFLERNPKNPIVDTVSPLLTKCAKLRVVDIRYELVDAKKVKEKKWVCLGLEELRCQFVGVPYLSEKEQVVVDRMLTREQKENEKENESSRQLSLSQGPATRSKEEEEFYDRTRQATEIRRQVLSQLSKLTHLKHLTLSPDLKITDFSNADMYSLIYRSKKDSQHYINYGDVQPDTLHLRRDCGLNQLATLTELEYLAFESMDPRMQTQDVEWIARHFRKLKEMRGLAVDTHVGMEDDPEKGVLRELMQRLRPDILHTESPGYL